jgi:hypothetical protein
LLTTEERNIGILRLSYSKDKFNHVCWFLSSTS